MTRTRATLAFGLCAFVAASTSPALADDLPGDLRTIAERSNFRATARQSDVLMLCEKLDERSESVRLVEMGRSGNQLSLPLLIVADPPVATADDARASGKLVVFLFGNIHGGEVCGKEALPVLVRELTDRPHHPLLKDLILLVAPIYNADGNDRIDKGNRPGQVGPADGMGERANAQGLDLNRDYMKVEAPETRVLLALLNAWDPDLVVDTHTTNGSHHRYILTYEGAKNPAGDPRLVDYTRDTLFPALSAAYKAKSGLDTYFYGNFEGDHTRWTTYPSTPRFGTTYVGLRNRLSILTEAYSYAPYEARIAATLDFCREILRYADAHRGEIRKLTRDADARAISLAPGSKLAVRSEPRAFDRKVPVLGFVEEQADGRAVSTGVPKDYLCAIEQDFHPTVEVSVPVAYVIPPGFPRVVEVLKAHGIEAETTAKAGRRRVSVDRIDASKVGTRPVEKHRLVDVLATTERSEEREVPAGSTVVKTAQRLGPLAAYLLEPRSDDGFAAWNDFDGHVEPGQDYPVLKVR